MNIDLINGSFEVLAGLLQIANIVQIYKDKSVKGVTIYPLLLFTVWGLFNLIFFYPTLQLWLSWMGGSIIIVTNVIWIILYFKYKKDN